MKLIPVPLFLVLFFAYTTTSPAADPAWWAARGVTTAAPASNLSPVTVGQAKHITAMALAELQTRLSPADYQQLQTGLAGIIVLTPAPPPNGNPAPPPPGYLNPSQVVVVVGQLKAIAKPFYDVLRARGGPGWMDWQMSQSNIRVSEPGPNQPSYSPYPWSVATTDDENKALATLGQLKAIFSIDFSQIGVIRYDDTDGDGMPDSQDAFPTDPTRWDIPATVSGDASAPVILLTAPDDATPL